MSTPDGFTLWLTGLPGAGKSTLAQGVGRVLLAGGHRVEILDGDEIRKTLSTGLGFSREDRDTNVRRIGFVAQLLSRNGVAVIVAAISPYRKTRDAIRREHEAPFLEVFVDCRLDELVRRDVKGLYAKALSGELMNFTGISDPYEAPLTPDVHVRTDHKSIEESVAGILEMLTRQGVMRAVG